MRAMIFCILALVAAPTLADFTACRGGVVFVDANGNGVRDRGEPGVPGARVSDGERIVVTDSTGAYQLHTPSGSSTFLIKPAGFRVAHRGDGLPDTWTNVQTSAGPALRYGGVPVSSSACRDFALTREGDAAASALEVLVFGDPQPKTRVDVDYYRRDIVEPVRGKHRARLGISLGDIVSDDLSLFPALKAVDATLGIPWLHAPGNHDIDFDATSDERSLDSFRHAFGPDTYAWEETRANFIVLDDVIYLPGKSPGYIGGLREQQFTFLHAYLANAPKNRLLVLSLHIPLFDTTAGVETFRRADRARLFALLQPFPNVLVLSAHSHKQQHFFHGPDTGWLGETPLHEYNVGATCGAFWSGVKDAAGIPATTMSDGTPNGYALLTVRPDAFDLRWFVARAADDFQIQVHAPKVLRHGSYPAFAVYANVFMGAPDTKVEYRIDDGEWKPMRRVLRADPTVVAENLRDDKAETLRGYDRLPEAAVSTHLWRGVLATDLSEGAHRVEVRASLPGFGVAEASVVYRLEGAGW